MEIEEIDTFRHSVGRTTRDLWRNCEYRPSSSSWALRSTGKVAYICVWTIDKYEWYAFDVSDDIKHNQIPRRAININDPISFHKDDVSGVANLKPQVTANMDWILGWEILGFKTLYILDDWKGPSAWPESNRVDRIDLSLTSSSPWEWEPVQNMPNQITASAHTCVLGGKFYCFGGGDRSQKVEPVGKSRLAMSYYPSSKAGTSSPPPPCLDLDKILSAFKEVPKPYLDVEKQCELYVRKQLSSAIFEAIKRRFDLEKTIYTNYLESEKLHKTFRYLYFVRQKYLMEKLFHHHYVRQKYFHKKLLLAIKDAQPCSMSLNSPVMDCFLEAVSSVEEFFRPSVEEYQQILKTSVVFHKLSVEEFAQLPVEKFLKISIEEFHMILLGDVHRTSFEVSHGGLIEEFEEFHRALVKEFYKPSVEEFKEFHKTSVEEFLETIGEEIHKTLVEEFHQTSEFHMRSVEEFHKTSVEEFHKTSVEEFLKPSEFHMGSVAEFHTRSVEEFLKQSVLEFLHSRLSPVKRSVVFPMLFVEEFLLLGLPLAEEFLKSSVEEFLKPRSPPVEEFFKPGFPSQNMELERQSLWVMAYDMREKIWEPLLDPPVRPVKIDSIFTAAREFPNQCIVVGLPEDGCLQIYHVNTQQWEVQEFKICPKFGPKVLTGPALSVDTKLYWYSVDDHCLVGYDLVTKMWFMGNCLIHDHGEFFGVRDVDTPPRLAHLSGDNFCLLWVSVLQHRSMKSSESKDDCISRLHCMKFRVITRNFHPDSGIISLEVSILSCQSYLASGLKFFRGGLVV